MQKELEYFARVLGAPQSPFVAILGGSKISDKIMVIENLLTQCDHLCIGGGMAYTFLKVAHGVRIGASLFDAPGAEHVQRILQKAREHNVQIHLPVDHVIADAFDERARIGVTDNDAGIPDGWMALDIGPQTRARFSHIIQNAKTVLWNGPVRRPMPPTLFSFPRTLPTARSCACLLRAPLTAPRPPPPAAAADCADGRV